MTAKPHILQLKNIGACSEAVEWAESYNSMTEIWNKCERGDWMFWLLGKFAGPVESEGRKKLVLSVCECARLALPVFETKYPNDNRLRNCIETAEAWARGGATIKQLVDGYLPAITHAQSVYETDYVTTLAAYAVTHAAFVAVVDDVAIESLWAVSYAASAVAHDASDYTDVRRLIIRQGAAIARKHYPTPPEF